MNKLFFVILLEYKLLKVSLSKIEFTNSGKKLLMYNSKKNICV